MAIRYGEILVKERIITPQELEIAIKEQQKTKELLGQVLVRKGFVTERRMLQVLAKQQGIPFLDSKTEKKILQILSKQQKIPFLDLKDTEIDEKAIKNVPAKFARHYKIMPISIKGNKLTVAMSNPFDIRSIDDLEVNLEYRVMKVLATSGDISEAIRKYYGVGADTIERILAREPRKVETEIAVKEKVEDLEKMAEDASVVKLVNQILERAIKDRATDIHIEHFRNELLLRYRIDGVLYETPVGKNIKYLDPAIVSRIKVMSGLDIVERRLPQDGRAKVKIGKNEYELRVSILPTLYGEDIVIRILPTRMLFSISDLGIFKKDLEILERLIELPHGIIFVVGPTGSGKTTTLYAYLSKLNTRERKIVTIEDPIEYELRGVSQIQINPRIGLTFAQALRSVLRHDPDVMMVGEIRDFDTAEIAIRAALTGHLVFSTVHTNDAASGITRLIDIGIPPYLVASSVRAFVAQRLVRVICDKCKESYLLSDADYQQFKDLKLKTEAGKTSVYRGKGCKACNSTGYMGRIGIYEILVINDEIRKLILQKVSSDIIEKKALELGMRTLKQDGWEKALAGITTLEEVMRVTQTEEVGEV